MTLPTPLSEDLLPTLVRYLETFCELSRPWLYPGSREDAEETLAEHVEYTERLLASLPNPPVDQKQLVERVATMTDMLRHAQGLSVKAVRPNEVETVLITFTESKLLVAALEDVRAALASIPTAQAAGMESEIVILSSVCGTHFHDDCQSCVSAKQSNDDRLFPHHQETPNDR